MRCEICGNDNPASSPYCNHCGAPMGGKRCRQGHAIPEGLTDCPFCPRPISAGPGAPTAMLPPSAATEFIAAPTDLGGAQPGGSRSRTVMITPEQLAQSGVRPNVAPGSSPGAGGAALPGMAPPPTSAPAPGGASGRSRTIFRMPGEQAQAPAAPAMPGAPFPAAAPVPARTQSPLAGFLVTSSLDPSGQFWPVRFGRTTVGKDADNDVRLDAPGLSGKHCEIMVREQAGRMKIWLTDSNSTNGTRRNGEDIFTERPDLANHDIIGVGDVDLMLILIPFGPG